MIILCLISRDDRFRLDEGLTNKGWMRFVFGTLGENGTTQKNCRIENATRAGRRFEIRCVLAVIGWFREIINSYIHYIHQTLSPDDQSCILPLVLPPTTLSTILG